MSAPAYSERLDDAVALVVEAFRGTYRKGTSVPYLTHLFGVMSLVGEHGGDEDQLVAALLHDYLEDIDPSGAPMLALRFGVDVATLVLGMTDALEHPKPPWKERKVRYIAHLPSQSPRLRLVCASDKLHNCRTVRADLAVVGLDVFDRFRGGQEGTLWYYRAVAQALGDGWSHAVVDRLHDEVDALHADVARLT